MLYFRDYRWLCDRGRTRFDAHINPAHRTRDDVMWFLDLHYVAGGSAWRRIRLWERTAFSLNISGFAAPTDSWEGLGRLNFWSHTPNEFSLTHQGGFLSAHFRPKEVEVADSSTLATHFAWRVAARDGRWFTIELAGFADGRSCFDALASTPIVITSDGTEERAEPDAEFWQANAQIYLLEHVPFGTVTVQVPRNARNPEEHALARAQDLIGVSQPEHLEVTDFCTHAKACRSLANDLYVKLHFHGQYED